MNDVPEDVQKAQQFRAVLAPLERELEIFCRRLLRRPEQTRDAVQNAVLRAYGGFDVARVSSNPRGWLFRVLTQEIMELNHKHQMRRKIPLRPEYAQSQSAAAVAEAIPLTSSGGGDFSQNRLSSALDALTDQERAVFLLRVMGDFRYGEIANILNLPAGSIMGHLVRARQKMHQNLDAASSPTSV